MAASSPSWTDILTAFGTVASAGATFGAVVVALKQSRDARIEANRAQKNADKARRDTEQTRKDILQARKDEFIPLVSLDWGEGHATPTVSPNATVKPHGADLNSIVFGVTNVGNAPALNVTVEVDQYGTTSGVVQYGSPTPTILPKVHLMSGRSVELVKVITPVRVLMPVTFRIRLSYESVMGDVYTSEWYKFTPSNGTRIEINDFRIPSAPITEPEMAD